MLQAFEAAARHLSFSRAADELGLTQAAISLRIRTLEDHLGFPLFDRGAAGLRLTDGAAEYLDVTRTALAMLADAADRVRRCGHRPTVLRLSVLPSLARRWLVPRLGRLAAALPGVELELWVSDDLADLAGGEVDAALRFGRGAYGRLAGLQLMDDAFVAVCRPDLAEDGRLTDPSALAATRLLHDDLGRLHPEGRCLWTEWLRAEGMAPDASPPGIRFGDAGMMVEAALAGAGIALARRSLVADDLAAGRLVQPFPRLLPSAHATHFMCRRDRRADPAVARLRSWLIQQAAAMPQTA